MCEVRLSPHAVRAERLVVRYGATVALGSSTFEIPAGTVTVVIGPNGSGKSTLLNAIAGLVVPAEGSIDVRVEPGRVAYVMQSTKVSDSLPVTVREVVTMGRYASTGELGRLTAVDRKAVEDAMDRMGISDLSARHLGDLSGGQRQRAFMAQGLAQDHDLLLLDEPLTGIDLTAAQAIDDEIHRETEEGCTVVMTTHDLSEATLADFVILVSGRVVAHGPPSDVLTEEHLVSAYGPSLLHVERGRLFLDDPAHQPVLGRHTHRERTIHTESSRSDRHPPV